MYAVIMAGGRGTRFWPRSRAAVPKQLLDISGTRTMIQQTVDRIRTVVPEDKILVVTNSQQAEQLCLQLPHIPSENIIVEPLGRNTAPCICLAATKINHSDPGAVMVVLPADHYIGDSEAFLKCLKKAAEAAITTDSLVTIGIKPSSPETGYGYIQFNEHDKSAVDGVLKVVSFHEKPDKQRAERFLKSGNFLWNSGMFIWKTSSILQQIKQHLPDVYDEIIKIQPLWGTQKLKKAIAVAYEKTTAVSIDYGVLEKADDVLTVAGDFGWNDIGTWSAIHGISEKDSDNNVLQGDVVAIDSKDTFVYSREKLVAVVGLNNIVIVDTGDALLVCSKEKTQDVKKIVDQLEAAGRKEFL